MREEKFSPLTRGRNGKPGFCILVRNKVEIEDFRTKIQEDMRFFKFNHQSGKVI